MGNPHLFLLNYLGKSLHIYILSLIRIMAYTTGMSKEGKKLFNSTNEDIQKNMLSLLSAEDKAILDRNVKKEGEKMMKQIAKNGLVKMK